MSFTGTVPDAVPSLLQSSVHSWFERREVSGFLADIDVPTPPIGEDRRDGVP